ncbi:methylglutaconyl-CoA hydratase [Mytilus galloprovincialis]|uniref:Methylglutaconyl-CoA hydratase n=1 Tax=Mytilus galloprovincialis TaxID=29158 RepID=A0A8B6DNE4_MYTGA|nr:methylglutaconyl-CoA hydratase [Mytilus galloprovincialis]
MAASVLCRVQRLRKDLFLSVSRCSVLLKNTYLVKSNETDECSLEFLEGDNEGIAVISMNRPKAKNSLGKVFLSQFQGCINNVKFEKNIRVLIIRSMVPGVFCAGADLKERAKMTNEEVGPFVAGLRQSVTDLANIPMPTIAAIDGYALGGGLEMSLACDMRTASSNAKMGLVETKRGIIPGGGGTQRLTRVVGPALAKELIFTARMFDGHEAAKLGVVNHSVDQNDAGDAAYQRAVELALEITPNGPVALRMAKMAISKGSDVDLTSGMGFEECGYAQVIPTKDRIEGMKSFIEKRAPVYKGE